MIPTFRKKGSAWKSNLKQNVESVMVMMDAKRFQISSNDEYAPYLVRTSKNYICTNWLRMLNMKLSHMLLSVSILYQVLTLLSYSK